MLTEQELLAMPEEDYMNEQQLNFFATKLRDMYSEVAEEVTESKQELSRIEDNHDPLDTASRSEMQQLELRKMERLSKLLYKIEASLRDIERGDYGYCRETGEPIGLLRLLARPTATLSIEAKQRQEHLEKSTWDED
jgi:DnaK suppressor protein